MAEVGRRRGRPFRKPRSVLISGRYGLPSGPWWVLLQKLISGRRSVLKTPLRFSLKWITLPLLLGAFRPVVILVKMFRVVVVLLFLSLAVTLLFLLSGPIVNRFNRFRRECGPMPVSSWRVARRRVTSWRGWTRTRGRKGKILKFLLGWVTRRRWFRVNGSFRFVIVLMGVNFRTKPVPRLIGSGSAFQGRFLQTPVLLPKWCRTDWRLFSLSGVTVRLTPGRSQSSAWHSNFFNRRTLSRRWLAVSGHNLVIPFRLAEVLFLLKPSGPTVARLPRRWVIQWKELVQVSSPLRLKTPLIVQTRLRVQFLRLALLLRLTLNPSDCRRFLVFRLFLRRPRRRWRSIIFRPICQRPRRLRSQCRLGGPRARPLFKS